MFKVRVYFGAVTGGQNGISGSPRAAGNYVFRTHSITFTRNDVYMTSTHTHTNYSPVAYIQNSIDSMYFMMFIQFRISTKLFHVSR